MRSFLVIAALILGGSIARADILSLPSANDPFAGVLTIRVPTVAPTGMSGGQPYYGQFPGPGDFGSISVQVGDIGLFSTSVDTFSLGNPYVAQGFHINLDSVPTPFSNPQFQAASIVLINAFTSGFFPGRFVTGLFGLSYQVGSDPDTYYHLFGNISSFVPLTSSEDEASFAFSGTLEGVNVHSVPEPSTWAMLLIGFASIGFAAYKRRSKTPIPESI